MHALVRAVFSRLHTLDPETEERKLVNAQEPAAGQTDLAMTPAPLSADAEIVAASGAQPESSVGAKTEQDASHAARDAPRLACAFHSPAKLKRQTQ
jgi:hypothetical protein